MPSPDPAPLSEINLLPRSPEPEAVFLHGVVALPCEPSGKGRSPRYLIVVENEDDIPKALFSGAQVMMAAQFLDGEEDSLDSAACVINLCRGYKYLSIGYYCSLLAEARGQSVYPSACCINDLSRKTLYQLDIPDLGDRLNEVLDGQSSALMPGEFAMDVCWGFTRFSPLSSLAKEIFETFPAPLLHIEFERQRDWQIRSIRMLHVGSLNARQRELLAERIAVSPQMHLTVAEPVHMPRYRIAILHDPDEALPPSNPGALDKFVAAGRKLGAHVELIEKKDFAHIAEYDGLFIRETTAINHHTYRFAKKAEKEGLVVIDDAASILRCTNKVFLADLLSTHNIPTPRTIVVHEGDASAIEQCEQEIGYPMVVKIPDGAFSCGVSKASNRQEWMALTAALFKQSSLIIVQEYLYTEFDWRIGVLNGRALYASKYFMSKRHWQVAKRDAAGKAEFGVSQAVALGEVPREILIHAVAAARLIGDSLYGVDMKMTEHGAVVIEVNDNPNVDAGIEDGIDGDMLFTIIMRDMLSRIEKIRVGR